MKPSFPLQIYCCPWQVRPFCQEFENFLQNTLGEKTHYSVQTTENSTFITPEKQTLQH